MSASFAADDLWIRAITAFIFVGLVLIRFLLIHRFVYGRNRLYEPDYDIVLTPILYLIPIILMLVLPHAADRFVNRFLGALLSLICMTTLLLLLKPLLRKWFSARDCAEFWLLPCIGACVCVYLRGIPYDPFFVIRLPQTTLSVLLAIWIIGFLCILGWKLVSHLLFRRTILRNAVSVSDYEQFLFRDIWESLDRSKRSAASRFRIVISPTASSPLSVGLFYRTTYVVLPKQDYSEKELRLIFRHEIIHLLQRDNLMKFSISLFCAAGWFIPTLWFGMRSASEDLELRCDEEATKGMNEDARKEYAVLLLNNAGSAKGYSTCLSVTASGLRYRLSRVLRPESRKSGLAMLCLLMWLFVFSLWSVGIACRVGTIQTAFLERDGGNWQVAAINPSVDGSSCADPDAVQDYLRDLKLTKLSWVPESYTVGGSVVVSLRQGDERTVYLEFLPDRNMLQYVDPDDRSINGYYQIDGSVDLQWLRSMQAAES